MRAQDIPGLVIGIYRIYDPVTGESFVGFSRNIEGTLKRFRFELPLNACSYKALQKFWNERKGNVLMETLEEFSPPADMDDFALSEHLEQMMYAQQKRLGENTKLVQMPVQC